MKKQINRQKFGYKAFILICLVCLSLWFVLNFNPFNKPDMSPDDTDSSAHLQKTTSPAVSSYSQNGSAQGLTDTKGYIGYTVPLKQNSPWPQYGAGNLLNGRANIEPINTNLFPFAYGTSLGIFVSPVIDFYGTAYFGSSDRFFYAVNIDGSLKWKTAVDGSVTTTALLDNSDNVFFGTEAGSLYCLSANSGEIIWQSYTHSIDELKELYKLERSSNCLINALTMLSDGTLVGSSSGGMLYGFDTDNGNILYNYMGSFKAYGPMAASSSLDKVFFSEFNYDAKNIFSVDLIKQKSKWTKTVSGFIGSGVMLTNSGNNPALIVSGTNGCVYGLSAKNGNKLWQTNLNTYELSKASQLSDGTIIVTDSIGTAYGLSPENGKCIWSINLGNEKLTGAAVDGADNIYIGDDGGYLYCIDKNGAFKWAYKCIDSARNNITSSPALGFFGIYVTGENGAMYFIPYNYPLICKTDNPSCITDYNKLATAPQQGGAQLVYVDKFGNLSVDKPDVLSASQPISFRLMAYSDEGEAIKCRIDEKSINIAVTDNPSLKVSLSADKTTITLTPESTWAEDSSSTFFVKLNLSYKTGYKKLGAQYLLGKKSNLPEAHFSFNIKQGNESKNSLYIPEVGSGKSSVFGISRIKPSTPSTLSYFQSDLESALYMGGIVSQNESNMVIWVVEAARDENNRSQFNTVSPVRFPMLAELNGDLLSFNSIGALNINSGKLHLPFESFSISGQIDLTTNDFIEKPYFSAVLDGAKIPLYSSAFKGFEIADKHNKIEAFGTANLRHWGTVTAPQGLGVVTLKTGSNIITISLEGTILSSTEHIYSVLLVDENGMPINLDYTNNTSIASDKKGRLSSVNLKYAPKELPSGEVTVYFMIDTFPAAAGKVRFK